MAESEKKLEGYTGNDTNQFYFIAGVNVIVLAIIIAVFSGVSAPAAAGTGGVVAEAGMTTWFAMGQGKWAANERPWQQSSESAAESAATKAKVVEALRSMKVTGLSSDVPIADYNKDDVLLTMLEMIDTPQVSFPSDDLSVILRRAISQRPLTFLLQL